MRYFGSPKKHLRVSLVAQRVKNLSAVWETLGSIPGLGRSPGKGTATHCSILAWRIPWIDEPGGYSPWGHKESDTTKQPTHPLQCSCLEDTMDRGARWITVLGISKSQTWLSDVHETPHNSKLVLNQKISFRIWVCKKKKKKEQIPEVFLKNNTWSDRIIGHSEAMLSYSFNQSNKDFIAK